MNRKKLAILMAAMLCSKGLQAEETSKGYIGQEVVVSATKTLNRISDAGGSSVTVITSRDIENSGQQTVEELIKGTTGLDVVSTGGLGTNATVFMRGADSRSTLVLIDGVPVNDPSSANRTPDLANLTIDNIERIEVVRGPVSVLYGSNAMAGVINIITRKGGDRMRALAGVEGGSFGTWKAYAAANGKVDRLTYSFAASRLRSDGFSVADDRNDRIPHNGNTDEKDGYENALFSTNLGYAFSKNVNLETILRFSDSSVSLDDYLWAGYAGDREDANPNGLKLNHTETHQLTGRVAMKVLTEPLFSTVYYNFSNQRRDIYDNEAFRTNINKGYLYEVGWQGDLSFASNHTLTAGISYQREHADNDSYGFYASTLDRHVGMNSAFLQDQLSFGGIKVVSAIRNDDNETFGNHSTWRIAPSATFGDTTFKASYGTGFRAPSLYELYSFYGNASLNPETSEGWDAGIEHRLTSTLRAGATWFHNDFDNRIDYEWLTNKYQQVVGITRTHGIESFAEWSPSKAFFVAANYTWMHGEDPDGNTMIRRPANKASLLGTWHINSRARVSTAMQLVGQRRETPYAYDKDGNPVGNLDSYVVVNLSGSYKVADNVELYGRIDNLFDRYYEEAWSYATPGRSAYAGVKVTL
ncbi:MAG: TonB-dependent receptor [Chlorobiaceae bacterium]|nr:TonB-dependent receptor [Chlorobiaceae bacterium]